MSPSKSDSRIFDDESFPAHKCLLFCRFIHYRKLLFLSPFNTLTRFYSGWVLKWCKRSSLSVYRWDSLALALDKTPTQLETQAENSREEFVVLVIARQNSEHLFVIFILFFTLFFRKNWFFLLFGKLKMRENWKTECETFCIRSFSKWKEWSKKIKAFRMIIN